MTVISQPLRGNKANCPSKEWQQQKRNYWLSKRPKLIALVAQSFSSGLPFEFHVIISKKAKQMATGLEKKKSRWKFHKCHVSWLYILSTHTFRRDSVWSGHSRWLFSCSLYTPVPPSISYSPNLSSTYLLQGPTNDRSNFSHYDRLCPPSGFPGKWWANLTLIHIELVIFPAPCPRAKAAHALPTFCSVQWSIAPTPCFRHAGFLSYSTTDGSAVDP